MRVAAIGGGGGSGNSHAGGGGGAAATKIIPASVIDFDIGSGGRGIGASYPESGKDTTAKFQNYLLIARGGSWEKGGTSSGGDYNYKGGDPKRYSYTYSAGGGAAGPNGNGGGSDNLARYTGIGWGVGGGKMGSAYVRSSSCLNTSAIGGSGADGVDPIWGTSPYVSGTAMSSSGGSLGGGASFAEDACRDFFGNGGNGGIVVEWFFND